MKTDIRIQEGYIPGAIGRITEMHALYYSSRWGFGLFFERKVAAGLAEFLGRFDPEKDGFWLALDGAAVIGSVAIDGVHAHDEGAHLRWFIVEPDRAGKGLGKALMQMAIDFCATRNYPKIYLWTFEGLDAARHLYESNGFRLVSQAPDDQWGVTVNEQRFEWAGIQILH